MAAASTGKRGPVPELTVKVQKTQLMPNKASKNKQPKKNTDSTLAIRSTVEEILNPSQASLIPRMPRQPLFPSFYPGALSLKAADGTQPFRGSIIVRPDLDNFIEVLTDNGGTVSLSGATVKATDRGPTPILTQVGHFYSIPYSIYNSSNQFVQKAVLKNVDEQAAYQYHYMDDLGVWRDGAIWCTNGTMGASTNANFTDVKCSSTATGTVTAANELWSGSFIPNGPIWNSPTQLQLVVSTSSYSLPDYTPATGYFTIAFVATVDTSNPLYFDFFLNSVDLTLNTTTPLTLPIGPANSPVYAAVRSRATAYSITRYFANLAWRGADAYDAGNLASALVPHNLPLAEGDPTVLIDEIGRLPYRKVMRSPSEGLHAAYLPQRVQDLFLIERGSLIKGNEIVIAFDCPPTGSAGQAAAFLLTWGVCVEWEIDDPSLPQLIPPWGKDCYDEIIGVLGDINPVSGNPEHVKKIKEAIQRVTAHPAVKQGAQMALQVAKQGAKIAIPTLLSLM